LFMGNQIHLPGRGGKKAKAGLLARRAKGRKLEKRKRPRVAD